VDPYVGDLINHTNFGGSKYHSLQVRIQTRARHGLTAGIAYTYSHNMTNSGENQGADSAQNARNLRAEWGNATYDRRQVLVINHVYQLPFGKGRSLCSSGWLSQVVGHWDLDGVLRMSRMRKIPATGVPMSGRIDSLTETYLRASGVSNTGSIQAPL
jgi:hypothetical protein